LASNSTSTVEYFRLLTVTVLLSHPVNASIEARTQLVFRLSPPKAAWRDRRLHEQSLGNHPTVESHCIHDPSGVIRSHSGGKFRSEVDDRAAYIFMCNSAVASL
jgi:hypothetical protein